MKNFIRDQGGNKGGEISDLLRDTFFVFAKQIFCRHLNFFHFGININFVIAEEEFRKNIYYSRIKLIVQKRIRKILLIRSLFFFVFLEYRTRDLLRGHAADT